MRKGDFESVDKLLLLHPTLVGGETSVNEKKN